MLRILALCAVAMTVGCETVPAESALQNGQARYAQDPASIDPEFPPAILETNFLSGGDRLNGHLYLADGPGPHPTVIFLHGFPGYEKNLDLAQAARRAGWNAYFFHYRGAWGSEGTFTFTGSIDDVAAALAFLRDPANENFRVDPDRIALVGHSMGGFMALQGGARDDKVSCVAGIAAANLGERSVIARADAEALKGFSEYSDSLQMLSGFDGARAIRELTNADQDFDSRRLSIQLSGKNVLLVGAERDDAVDISVFERLEAAYSANPEINLKAIRFDADHSFSWNRVALTREVVSWLESECR